MLARIPESVKSNVRPIAPVAPLEMVDSGHARPLRGVTHDGDTWLLHVSRRVRPQPLASRWNFGEIRIGRKCGSEGGTRTPDTRIMMLCCRKLVLEFQRLIAWAKLVSSRVSSKGRAQDVGR